VESYFSDIGGTLGLYLGMSLMSVVEFFELALDLVIYAVIHACASMKARQRLGPQQGAGDGAWNAAGPSAAGHDRMPWESSASDGADQFAYSDRGRPPSYRAATRAHSNEVRDVLLNM